MSDLSQYYDNIEIDYVQPFEKGVILGWGCPGIGFGQLTFRLVDEKLEIDTECMSDAFVIAVLTAFSATYPSMPHINEE